MNSLALLGSLAFLRQQNLGVTACRSPGFSERAFAEIDRGWVGHARAMVLYESARDRSWKAMSGEDRALKARRLARTRHRKAGPEMGKPPVTVVGKAADTADSPGRREPRGDPAEMHY